MPETEAEPEPVDAGGLEAAVPDPLAGGLAGAALAVADFAGAGFAGAGFAGAGLDDDLLLGSHLPPAQIDAQSRS